MRPGDAADGETRSLGQALHLVPSVGNGVGIAPTGAPADLVGLLEGRHQDAPHCKAVPDARERTQREVVVGVGDDALREHEVEAHAERAERAEREVGDRREHRALDLHDVVSELVGEALLD
jgi:hypothetical protein